MTQGNPEAFVTQYFWRLLACYRIYELFNGIEKNQLSFWMTLVNISTVQSDLAELRMIEREEG